MMSRKPRGVFNCHLSFAMRLWSDFAITVTNACESKKRT